MSPNPDQLSGRFSTLITVALRKAEIQFSHITIIVRNKTKKTCGKNCPETLWFFHEDHELFEFMK
jgi:hypothetical protein